MISAAKSPISITFSSTPTSFAADKTSRQKFLISEAVRGEGAYLLNCHKERFMHLYDKRLELAPATWWQSR